MSRVGGSVGPMQRAVMTALVAVCVACGSALAEDAPPADPAASSSIQILLDDGRELQARRIRTGSYGLRVALASGRDSVVAANRVRRITDEKGRDRTSEVLSMGREIRVGGAAPPKIENAPPGAARWHLGFGGGPASPTGSFGDEAASGYGLNAFLERRTRRRTTFGARLRFAEFGGDADLEAAIAQATAGELDQFRYRHFALGALFRTYIVPDRRIEPFLEFGVDFGVFTRTLSGPAEEASATAFSITTEYALGARAALGDGLAGEILGGYARVNTFATNLRLGSSNIPYDGGGNGVLRLQASVVRRFGGNGR